MPDPAPGKRYTRNLDRLVAGYVAAIAAAAEGARRALVDELLSLWGGDAYALKRAIERELDALGREVAGLSRPYRDGLDDATADYARRQFDLVRRVDPSTPDYDTLRMMTSTQRAALLATLAETPQWVAILRAQLLAGADRLRGAQEDERAAAGQLFALPLSSGRASAWRVGMNDAALFSDRLLVSVGAGLLAVDYIAGNERSARAWQKQALATIDMDTTDCCLQVHGQVQALNDPFHLTGTPRFADYMQREPFHWNCRTDVAIYLPELEEVALPTKELRADARAEMASR
jgi:hypothetical protein